jgi:hypothetical protein
MKKTILILFYLIISVIKGYSQTIEKPKYLHFVLICEISTPLGDLSRNKIRKIACPFGYRGLLRGFIESGRELGYFRQNQKPDIVPIDWGKESPRNGLIDSLVNRPDEWAFFFSGPLPSHIIRDIWRKVCDVRKSLNFKMNFINISPQWIYRACEQTTEFKDSWLPTDSIPDTVYFTGYTIKTARDNIPLYLVSSKLRGEIVYTDWADGNLILGVGRVSAAISPPVRGDSVKIVTDRGDIHGRLVRSPDVLQEQLRISVRVDPEFSADASFIKKGNGVSW